MRYFDHKNRIDVERLEDKREGDGKYNLTRFERGFSHSVGYRKFEDLMVGLKVLGQMPYDMHSLSTEEQERIRNEIGRKNIEEEMKK